MRKRIQDEGKGGGQGGGRAQGVVWRLGKFGEGLQGEFMQSILLVFHSDVFHTGLNFEFLILN